jgi:hypothetical protein
MNTHTAHGLPGASTKQCTNQGRPKKSRSIDCLVALAFTHSHTMLCFLIAGTKLDCTSNLNADCHTPPDVQPGTVRKLQESAGVHRQFSSFSASTSFTHCTSSWLALAMWQGRAEATRAKCASSPMRLGPSQRAPANGPLSDVAAAQPSQHPQQNHMHTTNMAVAAAQPLQTHDWAWVPGRYLPAHPLARPNDISGQCCVATSNTVDTRPTAVQHRD